MAAALGSAAWRARVLAEYRTALRLSAALPAAAERETALAGLRAEMRAHAGLKEEDRALDELRRLAARSGFLRMVTPARSRRARDEVGGTYVMRDGRLVRGTGETQGVRATDGSVSFEDARARNMADMQRMNFGRKQDLSALRPLI